MAQELNSTVTIEGCTFTLISGLDPTSDNYGEELDGYLDKVKEDNGGTFKDVSEVHIKVVDDKTVELSYTTGEGPKFERIARVTGYLSAVDNWNDGKRAELKERVKHT